MKPFSCHSRTNLNAARSGNWKLHMNKGKPTQLDNLETDIGEKQNVLKANPDIVRRLQNHLQVFPEDIAKNSRPAAFVKNAKPLLQ